MLLSIIMAPARKLKIFSKALKVSDRKGRIRMIYEYLIHKFSNPSVAEQYYNKYLFRKSATNPSDYIVTNRLAERVWYYSDMNYKFIFAGKLIMELYFSQFNIPVVRSIAYNINKMFFVGGQLVLINNYREFKDLLLSLKEQGKWTGDNLIIKKKEDTYGGRNIFKISLDEVRIGGETLENLYSAVEKGGYLYQNVVLQHPEIDRLNPHALNTLRIDTFINKEGVPAILNSTIKMSSDKSFVDNIGHGGIFAGIDPETGELHEEAYTTFNKFTGEIFLSHPLTGTVFKGFKIPFFQQAKQLALNAAIIVPQARIIGWDIGITQKGPVVLEGNYFNNLHDSEICYRGNRNNPVFQELIKELDVYYNEQGVDLKKLKEQFPLFVP
jgi:hypothetical protein